MPAPPTAETNTPVVDLQEEEEALEEREDPLDSNNEEHAENVEDEDAAGDMAFVARLNAKTCSTPLTAEKLKEYPHACAAMSDVATCGSCASVIFSEIDMPAAADELSAVSEM